MNITANTEFCDTVVESQQINVTIEEERIIHIASLQNRESYWYV